MKYQSTRGKTNGLSFKDVLLMGYAEDGGLFVPEFIPTVELETLKTWQNLSYVDIAKKVVQMFVSKDEIPFEKQSEILEASFATFSIPEVVRIERMRELNVAELWHGRSLAFKDLAMSCVANMIEYILNENNEHITAIIVTSGDTGSSAIEAVKGMKNIDVVVLFPSKGLSEIQEKTMSTVVADNVHTYSVDATNDELDLMTIELFSDHKFCKHNHVTSMNSTNWGRVMVQIAHHIYVYLQMTNTVGEVVDVIIPTGGAGNVAAGMFARKMGVPINFICTVNRNNLFERIIKENKFKRNEIVETIAPAMNIEMPLNFERILWLVSNKDHNITESIMKSFQSTGEGNIPRDLHANRAYSFAHIAFTCSNPSNAQICRAIKSVSASDEVILEAMKRCYKENQYLACPHTCTSIACFYGLTKNGSSKEYGSTLTDGTKAPCICISTASPAKFSEAFEQAMIPVEDALQKPSVSTKLSSSENLTTIIKSKVESITKKWASRT